VVCTRILRLLPHRRLVASADVQGRACVIKLFVGKDAQRYWARELAGVRQLAQTPVAAPSLIATASHPSGARALLYQMLPEALPVSEDNADEADALVAMLACLHRSGCVHTDPHLDNFVRSEGQLYALDADGVRELRSANEALGNLAVLLAQFPPRFDDRIGKWVEIYTRTGMESPSDISGVSADESAKVGSAALGESALRDALKAARRERVRRYLKKTLRECSEFMCSQTSVGKVVVRRSDCTQELLDFAQAPEAALGNAEIVKAGNSATVFRMNLAGHSYIVKRYNLKSFWHRLRRTFKSRIRIAWTNGHWLAFLGVRTARPILLLETRLGPFVDVGYIVMEDRGSLDLIEAIKVEGLNDDWLSEFSDLVVSLRNAGIRHGDFKGTNFLVQGRHLALIDLDSMAEGDITRDLPRFMQNWKDLPQVGVRFRQQLADVGMQVA
jgi:tRNA A-37 threonylcarbamoyl transferase component Bud32